jgi:hypothetical protein
MNAAFLNMAYEINFIVLVAVAFTVAFKDERIREYFSNVFFPKGSTPQWPTEQ